MNHEKIINRPDGSKVKISVSVGIDMNKVYWKKGTYLCPANKRKFNPVSGDNLATEAEILEAKLELWEKIKPTSNLTGKTS